MQATLISKKQEDKNLNNCVITSAPMTEETFNEQLKLFITVYLASEISEQYKSWQSTNIENDHDYKEYLAKVITVIISVSDFLHDHLKFYYLEEDELFEEPLLDIERSGILMIAFNLINDYYLEVGLNDEQEEVLGGTIRKLLEHIYNQKTLINNKKCVLADMSRYSRYYNKEEENQ
jgi:hypothetical protein